MSDPSTSPENQADKRSATMSLDAVQHGNRAWWTRNTMAYDWHDEVALERFSTAWFDAIDCRFVHGARLFATDRLPFDRLIPFARLQGARVLEIGCGMGLHAELMARAGARVTAIDLSPTSVEATTSRFHTKGLRGTIMIGDAENLPFEDRSFDFVWSWGVIHHSARTARIVRHIARVLSADGESRIMVYNREGMAARIAFAWHHVLRGRFLTKTFDETLYEASDGYSARFYVPEQFEDIFRAFFGEVRSDVLGQDADAVPLPRRLRSVVLSVTPERYLRRLQARWGSFLFVTARKPY